MYATIKFCIKITIYWIPGHTSMKGNEMVDQATKEATHINNN